MVPISVPYSPLPSFSVTLLMYHSLFNVLILRSPISAVLIILTSTLFIDSFKWIPNCVQVDVYLSDSKLYKGQVLACDVHYNLAAISIQSDSPLTTAVLRGLDDIASLDLNELHQLCSDQSFQLRPHSNLFRIMPRTKIMVLRRLFIPPYKLQVDSGVFWCVNLLSVVDIIN